MNDDQILHCPEVILLEGNQLCYPPPFTLDHHSGKSGFQD